jgi:catechol 2,3-dioxygenase-like lactoylglutathione lyase family enzyme
MRSVTIGVRDIDDAMRLFGEIFGLTTEYDIAAPPELVALWGLPPATAVRLRELSCRGYPVGRVRLAQYDPPATEAVRLDDEGGPDRPTDIGPKAVDFYITTSMEEAVAALEAAGFRPRSRPIRYQFEAYETEELVLTGPDGVPFLIMRAVNHPDTSMRRLPPGVAYSEVPTVSVVAGDVAASRRFYGEGLGLVAGTDAEIAENMLDLAADLTGVPRGTRMHFLVYQHAGEPSGKYLLVKFFVDSARRLTGRMRPGRLGVSLYTHDVADLDALLDRLRSVEAPPVAGPEEIDLGSAGRWRIALVRGPNEDLFELREARSAGPQ